MATESKIEITHVYLVNGMMVVADSIESAIETYKGYYTDGEVRKVEQMHDNIGQSPERYDAIIRR